jgi:hypothetical protein
MLQTGGRSTRRLRRRLSAAAVVAIVGVGAVLVGCTSPEPAPIDEPTAEPTSDTPTRTVSPTPSETPTASPGSVEAQLHAATIAFYAAANEAYETLDASPIERLVVRGSQAGKRYIDYINAVKAKKHRFDITGSGLSVKEFKVEPPDADTQFETATFTLIDSGAKELDAAGRTVESFPADSWPYRIEFQRVGDKWLVLSQREIS